MYKALSFCQNIGIHISFDSNTALCYDAAIKADLLVTQAPVEFMMHISFETDRSDMGAWLSHISNYVTDNHG